MYSLSLCIYVNGMQRHPSSQWQKQLNLTVIIWCASHLVSPRNKASSFLLFKGGMLFSICHPGAKREVWMVKTEAEKMQK